MSDDDREPVPTPPPEAEAVRKVAAAAGFDPSQYGKLILAGLKAISAAFRVPLDQINPSDILTKDLKVPFTWHDFDSYELIVSVEQTLGVCLTDESALSLGEIYATRVSEWIGRLASARFENAQGRIGSWIELSCETE